MTQSTYWTIFSLLSLIVAASCAPLDASNPAPGPNPSLPAASAIAKRGGIYAQITQAAARVRTSASVPQITQFLRARDDKKTVNVSAIAVFETVTLQAYPPNWCGFVHGQPYDFVTCKSTETCALASSKVCCAVNGSCPQIITACENAKTAQDSAGRNGDGTLYCNSSKPHCQTLSYGTHATLLRCANASEAAPLVPASNVLSSYTGLKISYKHDNAGPGYTWVGVYKQDPSATAQHSTSSALQPTGVSEYLSRLGNSPPTCASQMDDACPFVFQDIQQFWNTSNPSDYFCGDMVQKSCPGLCLENAKSSAQYIKWMAGICPDYLNTYNPRQHHQEFYEHWEDYDSLGSNAHIELLPWKWYVKADNASDASPTRSQCSSPANELGSFALINIIILIASIIFSRRPIVQRITFGKCGKMGSSTWWLTGLISLTLNMTSSTINAVLARNTPGYSHVPVGQLILLWTSRPRMSWILLSLVGVQVKDSVYVGAAASVTVSEIVLQLIGLIYIGRTANYARAHGLFTYSNIAHIPGSQHARVMYAGAVLVLLFASFAVIFLVVILRAMRRTIIGRLRALLSAKGRPEPELHDNIELFNPWHDRETNEMLLTMKLEEDHITLVYIAALFLIPTFIGQWMFWGGFVHLYGDLYCPPNVWKAAGTWTGFSWLAMVFHLIS